MLGVLVSALVSACAVGSAPPSDNSARPAAAASVRAPIVKMMRIDKDAYPTPPPRSDKTRVVGLLLPLSDERDTIRALAGHLYNGAQLALFDALRMHHTHCYISYTLRLCITHLMSIRTICASVCTSVKLAFLV